MIEIDCGSVKSIDSGATQTEILSDDPHPHGTTSLEEVVKPSSVYSSHGQEVKAGESGNGTLSLAQLTSIVNDHTSKISQGSVKQIKKHQKWIYIQWKLQIRDASIFREMCQIRDFFKSPLLNNGYFAIVFKIGRIRDLVPYLIVPYLEFPLYPKLIRKTYGNLNNAVLSMHYNALLYEKPVLNFMIKSCRARPELTIIRSRRKYCWPKLA